MGHLASTTKSFLQLKTNSQCLALFIIDKCNDSLISTSVLVAITFLTSVLVANTFPSLISNTFPSLKTTTVLVANTFPSLIIHKYNLHSQTSKFCQLFI